MPLLETLLAIDVKEGDTRRAMRGHRDVELVLRLEVIRVTLDSVYLHVSPRYKTLARRRS